MYCRRCGNEVGQNRFCPRCGGEVQFTGTVNHYGVEQSVVQEFNLISAYKSMFKKYAQFDGRSRRSEKRQGRNKSRTTRTTNFRRKRRYLCFIQ